MASTIVSSYSWWCLECTSLVWRYSTGGGATERQQKSFSPLLQLLGTPVFPLTTKTTKVLQYPHLRAYRNWTQEINIDSISRNKNQVYCCWEPLLTTLHYQILSCEHLGPSPRSCEAAPGVQNTSSLFKEASAWLVQYSPVLSPPCHSGLHGPHVFGRGVCSKGECHCSVGWGGTNCETPRPPAWTSVRAHGTFLPDFRLWLLFAGLDPAVSYQKVSVGRNKGAADGGGGFHCDLCTFPSSFRAIPLVMQQVITQIPECFLLPLNSSLNTSTLRWAAEIISPHHSFHSNSTLKVKSVSP